MRRTLRASVASSLACGVLVTTVFTYGVGVATAEPVGPQGIASLVAAVANADQKLQDLGARIQSEQEGVNKAIVALQTARDDAATAQTQVDTSQAKLKDADAAITAAQTHFDTFAASTYMNGPSASYVTAKDPADILDTAAVGQTLNVSAQQAITDLQRARTERVNEESAARQAKQKADQAVLDAQSSQDAAVASLGQAQQTFKDQQSQLDQLTAERSAAQARLAAAREWSAPATGVAPQAAPAAAHSDPRICA